VKIEGAISGRRDRSLAAVLPAGVVLLAVAVWAAADERGVTNELIITRKHAKTLVNYPVQFGRPFLEGEIRDLPQALIDGAPVFTQADVKQRYRDHSVKFAILSFLIPSFSRKTIKITFQNQPGGNDTPLTTEQMLNASYDFDAAMEIAAPNCPDCATKTASARKMLGAGAYTYWTSGPVATTVIVADHASKVYDLGWQNEKVTTVAAATAASATTIPVADASGWTVPMLVRLNRINSTDSGQTNASEDISICNVDTLVTPHQLTVGTLQECPSVKGRQLAYIPWAAGTPVYPNYWKEAAGEQYRSFRPIFHATFWPGIQKVRVRFIGEIADTEKLQDQIYALTLALGLGHRSTVYSNPRVIHRASTRWTKEFWIGGEPEEIEIDHNLPYLEATRFIYNFDISRKPNMGLLLARYDTWMHSRRDLYDGATIVRGMGTGGDNDHTGFYAGWTVWWLYTMDNRMRRMATESADLGAAWLFHLREGNPTKKMTRASASGCAYNCDQQGIGRVMAITNRTSIISRSLKRPDRVQGDQPVFVGSISNGGWTLGMNHAWEPYTVPYILTGDFWYLEEAWFWSSFGAAYNLGPTTLPAREYMRGPTGAEGTISTEECKWDAGNQRWVSYPSWEEIRTQAWILRARVNTAFVSPDDTPEKSYFETLTVDTMAGLEGWHNIPPSRTDAGYRAIWEWANKTQYNKCGLSPLHVFGRGGPEFVQSGPFYGMDKTVTAEANGYGVYYMMFALGRAAELGFPAAKIAQWAGQYYIDLLTRPDSNPYLLQMGRYPTIRKSDYRWIDNWTDFKNSYTPEWANVSRFKQSGYAYVLVGAMVTGMAHQVTDSPASAQAWSFVKKHIVDIFDWSRPEIIKWLVIPREEKDDGGRKTDKTGH
jgi:hypothetical protein